jgi:hypothetical protein
LIELDHVGSYGTCNIVVIGMMVFWGATVRVYCIYHLSKFYSLGDPPDPLMCARQPTQFPLPPEADPS